MAYKGQLLVLIHQVQIGAVIPLDGEQKKMLLRVHL